MRISKRHTKSALGAALAILAVVYGCTQGDNPVDPARPIPGVAGSQILGFPVLANNPWNDPTGRVLSVAFASDASLKVPQQPFPVLYLLHDFDGDAKYFEQYNLQGILEDLYRNGEIGRMMVVTVDASNFFHGSYYRNSAASGQYADLVGSVIAHVERTFRVYTQGGRSARAIAGHGMGGFGAMRFAMDRPDLFGAVSSMSGPLSLGGADGNSGVFNWVDSVFAENNVTAGNDSAYLQIFPSWDRKYTRRLIAMAIAFSPHALEQLVLPAPRDTCWVCKRPLGICDGPWQYEPCAPCSSFTQNDAYSTTIKFATLEKKRTCVDTVLFINPKPLGVDLPFDSRREKIAAVWPLWLSQDIKSCYVANPHIFDSTAVYFDCGVDDDEREWGYISQNRDFNTAMAGTPHVYKEYQGFGGVPAGHSQFLQERLREIIKFHDKQFKHAPGPR